MKPILAAIVRHPAASALLGAFRVSGREAAAVAAVAAVVLAAGAWHGHSAVTAAIVDSERSMRQMDDDTISRVNALAYANALASVRDRDPNTLRTVERERELAFVGRGISVPVPQVAIRDWDGNVSAPAQPLAGSLAVPGATWNGSPLWHLPPGMRCRDVGTMVRMFPAFGGASLVALPQDGAQPGEDDAATLPSWDRADDYWFSQTCRRPAFAVGGQLAVAFSTD